jgi:hypothetical protein
MSKGCKNALRGTRGSTGGSQRCVEAHEGILEVCKGALEFEYGAELKFVWSILVVQRIKTRNQ